MFLAFSTDILVFAKLKKHSSKPSDELVILDEQISVQPTQVNESIANDLRF